MQSQRKRAKSSPHRPASAKTRARKGTTRTTAPSKARARPGTTSSRHVTRSQQKMLAAIGSGISTFAKLTPVLFARNTVVIPAVQHRKHMAMLAGLITRGFVKELGGGRYALTPKGRFELEA